MVDILAIGAHPDDSEIFMGGALLKFKQLGYKVGVCDLTKGEAGTFGSAKQRMKERDRASKILGLTFRESLDLPDSAVSNIRDNQLKLIEVIRKLKPELIFSFSPDTRHPDHHECAGLVRDAGYLAGLKNIVTHSSVFRSSALITHPELIYWQKPDFVIDITSVWDQKLDAIRAYDTQVVVSGKSYPGKTLIKSAEFWEILEARARLAGAAIGVKYGEPFFSKNPPNIADPYKCFLRALS